MRISELFSWLKWHANEWWETRRIKGLPAMTVGEDVMLMMLDEISEEQTLFTRAGILARFYLLSKLLGFEFGWSRLATVAFNELLALGYLLESDGWEHGSVHPVYRLTTRGSIAAAQHGKANELLWPRIKASAMLLTQAIDPEEMGVLCHERLSLDCLWDRAAEIHRAQQSCCQRVIDLLLAADDVEFEDRAIELLRNLGLMTEPEPQKKGPGAGGATPGPRGGNTLS